MPELLALKPTWIANNHQTNVVNFLPSRLFLAAQSDFFQARLDRDLLHCIVTAPFLLLVI